MIPLERRRPRRRPSTAPEHLLLRTEEILRASEVHCRLLVGQLEHARRTGDRSRLGALGGVSLLHVAIEGEALQSATADALAEVDPDLARRARLVAEAASSVVSPGHDVP